MSNALRLLDPLRNRQWTDWLTSSLLTLGVVRVSQEIVVLDVFAGDSEAVYGVLCEIYAGLLGFAIAVVAILVGVTPSQRLDVLMRSNYGRDVNRIFIHTVYALGLALLVTLAALATDTTNSSHVIRWAALGSLIVAVLRMARSIWLLGAVLELLRLDSSTSSAHSQASESSALQPERKVKKDSTRSARLPLRSPARQQKL